MKNEFPQKIENSELFFEFWFAKKCYKTNIAQNGFK